MFCPWFRTLAGIFSTPGRMARLTALSLLLLAPGLASAQTGSISGVVTTEGGSPLGGAQVSVAGFPAIATTDASGRFLISGLSGTDVTLAVRRLGYRPITAAARVGDRDVRITLREKLVDLEAVVVTGTPGGTTRRALGNAVSTINASAVLEEAQVNNVQQLINGRAAGVVIQPASGQVGTGARIRIRGIGSFALSNEPLLYIDGVRSNNSAATGPQNQGFGSSSISRINDINPDDIESIEIIKGPAAATLYGTEASGGVIQIITKKGIAGKPRWSASAKYGGNYLRNPEGRFPTNYQVNPAKEILSLDIVERENARGTPIFQTGQLSEYNLNLSGGAERATYYIGGGVQRSEGADPSNVLKRSSGRVSLNILPVDKVNINVNVGYLSGPTTLGAEAGFGGRVWSTVLADPRKAVPGNDARRGFHSGLPEEYDALYNFNQGLNRFTGGLQVTHAPLSWLTQRLSAGVDRTRENNDIYFPRIDALLTQFGDEALGYREITTRDIDYKTFDYSATATRDVTPALRSTTSAGGQYYRNGTAFVFSSGSVFPTPGLSSIEATTGARTTTEDFLEDATVGLYVQEQLGWHDRLFVTGAVRSDDNSAFGKNFNRVYYPKFSLSWVPTEERFWPLPLVSSMKLRAAYGESGKQPATFAAIATYSPVAGAGDVPAATPQFVGNADLGPERGKEYELGFDAGAFDDRLSLEFSYYHKKTVDAILNREIAPSLGYPGTQPFNAGAILNKGIELLARGRAWSRHPVSVDLTASVSTNDNKILSLGDPAKQFEVAGVYRQHRVGYPVGAWFEKRVVSAEFDSVGTAINVMCDNGDGGSMPCARAPSVYLGRTVPKVEGAFSSTVTLWKNIRLYGLIDYKRGHRKLDGNTRVRCTFFGGRCRENFYPLEFDPKRIAAIQSNRSLVDFLIDDASFAKLRELSIGFFLPPDWAARAGARTASISLAGRNLATWTRYKGLEPEAMFLGGSRGGESTWEQTTMPQLSQWVFTVNFGF